jgi:hypothetical protein
MNYGEAGEARWITSLRDTAQNTPLKLQGCRVLNYTIPLVLEGRYFLVELHDDRDAWSVFWFNADDVVVDFFRSIPYRHPLGDCEIDDHGTLTYREQQATSWLYKIETNQRSSTISVAYAKSILTHPVDDGCLILGGPMCVSNVAEAGVGIPVGMFASRDYRVSFRQELPRAFIEQLVERAGPPLPP